MTSPLALLALLVVAVLKETPLRTRDKPPERTAPHKGTSGQSASGQPASAGATR